MEFYLEDASKVLAHVKSSESGLSAEEAATRLSANGKNQLAKEKKDSLLKRFVMQFADPMTLVLLAAAGISIGVSVYSKEPLTDTIIILFVIIVNAILGVYQEGKAEKAIDALKKLSQSTAKVLRDGAIKTVPTEDLVVGDVILFESGDAIPADARLLESNSLKVEEAALTGESVSAEKTANAITPKNGEAVPINDRKNMVYTGSSVVYGRGQAVVTATGMDTQMGSIAQSIAKTSDEKTPLQKKLTHLGKVLSVVVIAICAFIFVFNLVKTQNLQPENILEIFMISVSLAVAAIPSGLAAVVTIQLAIGVTKLAKHNAIIRKLTAVETLGCTQIICTDKTGTLTQNKMTVVDSYTFNEAQLAEVLGLCNDVKKDKNGNLVGDPTEVALYNYSEKLASLSSSPQVNARLSEIPFDSERKMMSTFNKDGGQIMQCTKGAPDVILQRCTHYLKNSEICKLDETAKKEIANKNKSMSQKALRVLAASYRSYDTLPNDLTSEACENSMVFIGLVGMMDPVRPEVIDAVKNCKSAGIKPVMITGDHKDTAIAIGKELGIIKNDSEALTGAELDKMSDKELSKTIQNISIYARVQPNHKVHIVEGFKRLGKVVAMTGDGVNDAPSIKRADIGIGMGITGTDVTKNVADMVLSDDNFATIVTAVKEGRRIFDNIKKAIQFLLSSNISELISIFIATVLGFKIFSPIHILWINLVTDTFPALCLGMEEESHGLMNKPPRPEKESLFANGMAFNIAYQGTLISLLTLVSYFLGVMTETGKFQLANSTYGTTMAFLTMSLAETFHSFNVRSLRGSIFQIKKRNLYLTASMIFSVILINLVITVPSLTELFETTQIQAIDYFKCIALSVSVIPIVELVKSLQKTS